MNRSEEIAQIYLDSLGLGTLAHEPDGGVPPDFAFGDLAVEVRRLNQNHQGQDTYEGLETVQASLIRFFEKLLPTFGAAPEGKGWWVFYTFRRPFDGKAIKQALPQALRAFKANPVPEGIDLKLNRRFELDIRPASIPVERYFMLGGYSDHDAGGFVVAEIIRNLNLCIAEKTAKIAPYAHRYREWWLVLPDHIGPDLNAEERASIGQHIQMGPFAKVILINPQSPTTVLVLNRSREGVGVTSWRDDQRSP